MWEDVRRKNGGGWIWGEGGVNKGRSWKRKKGTGGGCCLPKGKEEMEKRQCNEAELHVGGIWMLQ